MEAVLNIVSYLRGYHNSMLSLDLTYPNIDHSIFNKYKWVDFYGTVKEAIPTKILEPRGKDVDLRMYVNRNHAVDKSTCRSRAGLLIYKNMSFIQWISKKQPKIETSFFGAEFVAMKHGMETLRGLQ